MDLHRNVTYRGLSLNDVTNDSAVEPLEGIGLDTVIIGGVTGVGYTEKRSQADGRDASDVYLDGRRYSLAGTVYGENRQRVFDRLADLKAAMSPTGAFGEQPGMYGYLPLHWYESTLDTRYVLDAVRNTRFRYLYALVRPLAVPEVRIDRDSIGGIGPSGGAVQFSVQLEARDPRIYVDPPVTVYIPSLTIPNPVNPTGSKGKWLNRGDYPAPLKLRFLFHPHANPGRVTIEAGGSKFIIKVPSSTVDQVIRYDGQLKVLTLEQSEIESLRMDLLSFVGEATHPLIPPSSKTSDGWSAWMFTTGTGTPGEVVLPIISPSRMWFDEAYA